MIRSWPALAAVLMFTLTAALPTHAATLKCPPDSVKVGNVCVDLYETSVWQIAPSNTALVKRVESGKVTLADLTAGGAVQLGCTGGAFNLTAYPANFPDDGNWTPVLGSVPPSPGVYAVSVPGVLPSSCITWFQANQACRLSGKRLLRNGDWQAAAQGTPDPGNTDNGTTDCNTSTGNPVNTGSRSNCKSSWGVFDMVGNVQEWVEDWVDQAAACTDWTTSLGIAGDDNSCFAGPGGAGVSSLPVALIRGGVWDDGTAAGVFAVSGYVLNDSFPKFGFRCAR